MVINLFALNRLHWSGLPERFASCPPAFGLLLYLRKALRQPAPQAAVRARVRKLFFVATGTVRLSQRSQGGARRAEDMSAGRRTAPIASSDMIYGDSLRCKNRMLGIRNPWHQHKNIALFVNLLNVQI
jgi:hypothetical protein